MQKLKKFTVVSDKELSKVTGGGKADYNFGYQLGSGFRKWTDGVARWWNKTKRSWLVC